MKYSYALIILLFITSCGVSKEKPDNDSDESTILEHGTAELNTLYNSGKDTAHYLIEYDYYYSPVGKLLPFQDSINDKINNFVRGNTEFEIDKTGNPQLSHAFFKQQLEKFDSISRIDSEGLEDYNLWELEAFISITEYDKMVELDLSEWSYTGGAHGNGYTGYHMIDVATGRELKLADFVNDIPAFTEIAEKYFRAEYAILPMANLEEIGFWFTDGKFALNDNFYFNEEGMHFMFNVYEIAPYSAGSFDFAIPLDEIRQYLKIQP